jgi:hypothetical protein
MIPRGEAMKANLKVILPAIGVAALLAFPAMTKAQLGFQNPVFVPPTPPPTITTITSNPAANSVVPTDLGHGLVLLTVCRDGGQPNSLVEMVFHNNGIDTATLNFLFSDGTKVTASGLVLKPTLGPNVGNEFSIMFNNKRIEGQFIFANSAGNTTVNLHTFDGGSFCEIRGTALFAANPPPPLVNSPLR